MKSKSKVTAALLLSLVLVFIGSVTGTYAAKKPTPPPDVTVQVFNPNHIYLYDGTNNLANNGNLTATASGQTFATQIVDTIGVDFQLQKWNGSAWINVGSSSSYSKANDSSYSKSITVSVQSGYYYRIVTTHWITEGATHEQGVLYGSSIYIN